MDPEEVEFLLDLGKEEFLRRVAYQMTASMVPKNPEEVSTMATMQALNDMDPNEMGSA